MSPLSLSLDFDPECHAGWHQRCCHRSLHRRRAGLNQVDDGSARYWSNSRQSSILAGDWLSAFDRYCCKSPKLTGDNFLARRRSESRLLIEMAPGLLPKSPVSLSPGDEVPHMFTRKPRLRLGKIVISSAKRLLQHYRPTADIQAACGFGANPAICQRYASSPPGNVGSVVLA
jgi:hypothetical protein